MKKNKATSIKEIKKLDDLLTDFEKNLKELEKFNQKLKKLQENANLLSNYYQSEKWMNDFDEYKDKKGLHILGEDYLYNALISFEQSKINILKQISKHL